MNIDRAALQFIQPVRVADDQAIRRMPIDERTMGLRRDLEGLHAAITRAGFAW